MIYLHDSCYSAITLLHVRYALYDHEASPKGYHVLPCDVLLARPRDNTVECLISASQATNDRIR